MSDFADLDQDLRVKRLVSTALDPNIKVSEAIMDTIFAASAIIGFARRNNPGMSLADFVDTPREGEAATVVDEAFDVLWRASEEIVEIKPKAIDTEGQTDGGN